MVVAAADDAEVDALLELLLDVEDADELAEPDVGASVVVTLLSLVSAGVIDSVADAALLPEVGAAEVEGAEVVLEVDGAALDVVAVELLVVELALEDWVLVASSSTPAFAASSLV